MSEPLAVAFVWHMHQPYYKRSRHGAFDMPWVRLHALKDYLDMVELTATNPSLHHTFNLVPSLVEQLEDYARGDFTDVYWDLTLKPAAELDPGERSFVVDLMCERSGHPRAQRYPRYLELSQKKEACLGQGVDACAATFSVAELRDLQMWFNLAWFDPVYSHSGPLAELVARGRDFAEADKEILAAAQAGILTRVLPAYRQAEAEGRIELSTSPYFHPILPLLVNTDLARISRADTPLPPRRFAHPEDAREQIRLAMEHHAATFGRRPRGMWCPEQGVGEDVVPLLAEAGVTWTIADEGVLSRSLGRDLARVDSGRMQDPDLLYHPYRLQREGRNLDIVFRDRVLSDLMGFTYRSWAPQDAAANLVWRLREIRESLSSSGEPRLITIALDGENAWEYYQDDGHEFLSRLYETLAGDAGFRCVTVGEFLDETPPRRDLPWLHTGSWVFADFSTWIGDPAHGTAWDLLHRARDSVAARRGAASSDYSRAADLDEAWHHILVAEGSDWFWWFSTHQESGVDHLWDLAFRRHLQDAYRCLGESPPADLFIPLVPHDPTEKITAPGGQFTPVIDGRISSPDEWALAGICRAPQSGTMQTSEARILEEVRYGRDQENLYLLFLPGRDGFPTDTRLTVSFGPSRELGLRLDGSGRVSAAVTAISGGEPGTETSVARAAFHEVIEVALPLARTGPSRETNPSAHETTQLDFKVTAFRGNMLVALLPERGSISLDVA